MLNSNLIVESLVISLANLAVCLHKLDRLPEAVAAQEQAIRLHLVQHAPSLLEVSLVDLVGQPCACLTSSMQLQIPAYESCFLTGLALIFKIQMGFNYCWLELLIRSTGRIHVVPDSLGWQFL